jgi:tetratricopeptide (TPR) repeat protein
MNDDAKREFLKAIAIGERKESIVFGKMNLANVLITEGKYPEALNTIDEALHATKIPAMGVYQTIGVIYMNVQQPEKALDAWNQELKLYPDSLETVLNLAIYHYGKGNYSLAGSLFHRIIVQKPDHYLGYYGLGQVRERENNLPEAARLYQEAIRIKPNDAGGHYFLASVYARLGDAKAITHFQRAIELNPRYCQAHNDLAVAYASLKNPEWRLADKEIEDAKALGCPVNKDFVALVKKNLPDD